MIQTSKKQMKLLAEFNWKDLSEKTKEHIRINKKTQIAAQYKYGYTQNSLWSTAIGMVFCEGYGAYCDIQGAK